MYMYTFIYTHLSVLVIEAHSGRFPDSGRIEGLQLLWTCFSEYFVFLGVEGGEKALVVQLEIFPLGPEFPQGKLKPWYFKFVT